ncbi:DEAD/DEAH box helicase [Flavilitoribacter nigricans]|uniref:DEAD/DEAH box helicase n=1 Tax=Flavilitoribacter nigricans (strain ATCC 23147 / DSM 23189 / NBRC 102662 / NCIMB 1420 / SS-2) TaxID=1122177 RepID=A0A2D0MXD9_FLAN2|nr:DEAD/DEAH box helicase family protein [Flavilitoribacter nigricans]PHN00942.1 DEAD/DEAH box helicase [Flavilitoribacter nigricans DSM 23189 = NBRC 102662]
MINFNKRLGNTEGTKRIDPIEIYKFLDRDADKGPLRPSQEKILTEWHAERREDNDIIIKLHTGQGKTLIGLLILQSYLNSGSGPVMYICPDKYLVEQTCQQASEFGFDYVTVTPDGSIPEEFYDSTSILIIHVQKVFHGFSKFGIGNKGINIGAIVLDDSHACINSIESSFSLKISREGELYEKIISLFEDYLKQQGYVTFSEIRNGESSDVLAVPYWAWFEKYEELAEICVEDASELNPYAWQLIKDDLRDCNCIISSYRIEITPTIIPIYKYRFFDKAKHRILMSATTNDDSSFIKSLAISKETVLNPFINKDSKWSGEKMILLPYYIDHELNREAIVNWLSPPREKNNIGFVALTPSNKDADFWVECGAVKATSENMVSLIEGLKNGSGRSNTVVFANRYDGIDLPDKSCRVLILDKRPYAQTLFDAYQEEVRSESEIINMKIAQKIEQGLGRGVRGEKDYCIIILTGANLLASIKNRSLKRFFSPQTRKQVDIGIELAKFAVQDAGEENDGRKIVVGAMKQCLIRDEGWKSFYIEQMDSIEDGEKDQSILETLELEAKAENYYLQGEFTKAKDEYQSIKDKHSHDDAEAGWYMQQMARVIYPTNKNESNLLQTKAHQKNRYLFRPISGLEIKKLTIKQNRSAEIRNWLLEFDDFPSLKIGLDSILSGLVFGPNYKKFEKSLNDLGRILGFNTERPELEWKEGPDNLWCIGPNSFLVIECKSGVSVERNEIVKSEAEQLLHSTRWFEKNYPNSECLPVLVIPSKSTARGVVLPKDSRILRRGKLRELKRVVTSFFSTFKDVDFSSITLEEISTELHNHSLTEEGIKGIFEAPYYRK